jgi:hypothetical protein
MYSALNCHNAARRAEFYLEYLLLNVAFTGIAECFKTSLTMAFLTLLCGECYEDVYTGDER